MKRKQSGSKLAGAEIAASLDREIGAEVSAKLLSRRVDELEAELGRLRAEVADYRFVLKVYRQIVDKQARELAKKRRKGTA